MVLRKATFDTAVYNYVVCFVYLLLCACHPMTSYNPPLSHKDYYLCWPGNCDVELDAQEHEYWISRGIMHSSMMTKENVTKKCL